MSPRPMGRSGQEFNKGYFCPKCPRSFPTARAQKRHTKTCKGTR